MIKHFLAYGQSDQASFRHPEVCASFDIMTVPGTIAAYYAAATAAFVLSSELAYLIDPRTPLFQGPIANLRASHKSLAKWHGEKVDAAVSSGSVNYLNPDFFDTDAVHQMVVSVIERQRNYSEQRGELTEQIDRYTRLRRLVTGADLRAPVPVSTGPAFVLAPYFAIRDTTDQWLGVNRQIWTACQSLSDSSGISPVVAVASPDVLESVMQLLPEGMSASIFFWVTGFDERSVNLPQLESMWNAVQQLSGPTRQLNNMYGGYFSICMSHVGLSGFGNGLTYSEARAWPALSSTGAAPARYYVPKLHAFLPQGAAAELIGVEPSFACHCAVCSEARERNTTVAGLEYHDLKRHFALARKWEIATVDQTSLGDLAAQLKDAAAHAEVAEAKLPEKTKIPHDHLVRWEHVLTSAS